MKRLAILGAEDPGDNSRILDMAIKARQTFPDDMELGRALGIINCKRGNYRTAADLLKQSVSQYPNDAKAAFYMGMCQYSLKKPDESKQLLQRALTLNLPDELASEARRVLQTLK